MNRPGGTFDFALATPTGCRMGCDCDDCQMVAEDASSHPSSPHRSYLGPQTPVVPDLPVLHNLQMRLRRRLRLCWRSEGRRESDDWLDSLNDGPFTPRHSAGVRKRCKEELMSPPMSTDSPLLRYSIKSQTGGPKRSRRAAQSHGQHPWGLLCGLSLMCS